MEIDVFKEMKKTYQIKFVVRRKPRTRSGGLRPSILNPQSSILNPQSSILNQSSILKRFIIFLFCLIFFNIFAIDCFAKEKAERIISLAPNLTEILFDIGAGKNIVGVSSYSDYPEEAKKIPIVASYDRVDVEKILTLHPTMIIAWQYNALLIELKSLGIPIYTYGFHQLNDIPLAMKQLGTLTHHEITADLRANNFLQKLAKLKRENSHRIKASVFYQLSFHPLMTLNRYSLIDEAIQLCGGKNIFYETEGLAPVVTMESVIKKNPSIILISNNSGFSRNDLKQWQKYPMIDAVKYHRLYVIDANKLERPGPRMIEGITQLCQLLR